MKMVILYIYTFLYLFFTFFCMLYIRNNILILFILLETFLLTVSIHGIAISYIIDDIQGLLFFFYILTFAGCEVAIGLSILVVFYRLRGILSLRYMNIIKG